MNPHPLVTILVPNYNYGRYLSTCLSSAVGQTYDNLEVIFVDNHSSDDSYDIAMEFQSKFKDRIRIFRSDENYGASRNSLKANYMMSPRSECHIYLSSDDYFEPTLVERSVKIMQDHPSVGFVINHRKAIDENDVITYEPPFYNCSCVVPSTEQMEVFMMAGIGVSTQCLRKQSVEREGEPVRGYCFDVAGDWFSNFCLASASDLGYIMDPLCTYRTHSGNETNHAIRNLTNSIEHVLLIHAFAEMAQSLGRPSVARRLGPAKEKLGTMCLRYCTQLLHEGDAYTARRYLHLAPVLRPDIVDEPSWRTLSRLSQLPPEDCLPGLMEFEATCPQKRMVSYAPPPGAIRL
ncbi:MAG: glycosyltransferase family A protein [Holophaga sp.]|nr:glycosyltransferase family A protein [Holophaga sp.]